jgi:hypothetical protein
MVNNRRRHSGRSRLPLSNERRAVLSGHAGINMRTATQAEDESIDEGSVWRFHTQTSPFFLQF